MQTFCLKRNFLEWLCDLNLISDRSEIKAKINEPDEDQNGSVSSSSSSRSPVLLDVDARWYQGDDPLDEELNDDDDDDDAFSYCLRFERMGLDPLESDDEFLSWSSECSMSSDGEDGCDLDDLDIANPKTARIKAAHRHDAVSLWLSDCESHMTRPSVKMGVCIRKGDAENKLAKTVKSCKRRFQYEKGDDDDDYTSPKKKIKMEMSTLTEAAGSLTTKGKRSRKRCHVEEDCSPVKKSPRKRHCPYVDQADEEQSSPPVKKLKLRQKG